jgi:hypothetical protein
VLRLTSNRQEPGRAIPRKTKGLASAGLIGDDPVCETRTHPLPPVLTETAAPHLGRFLFSVSLSASPARKLRAPLRAIGNSPAIFNVPQAPTPDRRIRLSDKKMRYGKSHCAVQHQRHPMRQIRNDAGLTGLCKLHRLIGTERRNQHVSRYGVSELAFEPERIARRGLRAAPQLYA